MAIYKYNHPLRKMPRAQVTQPAYIADEDGKLLFPCTMLDVSAGGAKLQIEDDTKDLPDAFILVLSKAGQVRRRCKAVWRTSKTVGVQFIGPSIRAVEK